MKTSTLTLCRLIVIVGLALTVSVHSAQARNGLTNHGFTAKKSMRVVASWYGSMFHGRKMANGKRFDKHKLTVAHNHFPLGTKLKIVNPENHKHVIAEVTDRGGFEKYGRSLDVSERVAQKLDFVDQGVTKLTIQVVYLPPLDITYHRS